MLKNMPLILNSMANLKDIANELKSNSDKANIQPVMGEKASRFRPWAINLIMIKYQCKFIKLLFDRKGMIK